MSARFTSGILALTAIGLFYVLSEVAAARAHLTKDRQPPEALIYCAGVGFSFACSNLVLSSERAGVAILIAALCASLLSDLKYGLVFDAVSLPCALLLAVASITNRSEPMAISGGAVCAGLLLGLYVWTRGRGIGLGDVKLAFCIGLALGPSAGPLAIGTSFVLGGFHAALMLLRKKASRADALPFVPYLAIGSTYALMFGWPALR